ncbi:MAG: hypothetical protein AAB631_01680 [Patescibacteria group bacterium]
MGSFETIQSPESLDALRTRVLSALKEKGPEDSETRELLLKWTLEHEALVEATGTSRATIEFNIERGTLYIEAGLMEEGLDTLESALIQAEQEGEDKLREQIIKKLNSAESAPEIS